MKQWMILGAGLLMLGCQEMHMHHHGHHDEEDEANEVHVKFSDAPAAVQSTLTKNADGKTIETLDKEEHHGKTIYEADVMQDGKNYEIKVAEDGTLLSKKLDMEDMEDMEKGKGSAEKEEKEEHEGHEK